MPNENRAVAEEELNSTASYQVIGMTCGHCVTAVTQEVSRLDGVRQVEVDLRPGEISLVTVVSDDPLPPEAVREAVDEAGYRLAG